MYCPQCSQKQVSDDIRYCSKCGFNLTDVAEALKNNGLVERNVIESMKELRKIVTKGLIILILSGVFFILSLIFGTSEPSLFVQFNLLVGILGFIFGLIWMVYFFWFKSNNVKTNTEKTFNPIEAQEAPTKILNESHQRQLTDSYIPPLPNLQTNELVEVSSITEGTTKLLKEEK